MQIGTIIAIARAMQVLLAAAMTVTQQLQGGSDLKTKVEDAHRALGKVADHNDETTAGQ